MTKVKEEKKVSPWLIILLVLIIFPLVPYIIGIVYSLFTPKQNIGIGSKISSNRLDGKLNNIERMYGIKTIR